MSKRPPVLPARLLIDLPNWVGDVALTLPALTGLMGTNANGATTLHCRPAVERLLELLFPGAEILATATRTAPLSGARRILAGGGRFDVGVTFRHSTRGKLLLLLTARHRLGSRGGGGTLLLSEAFPVPRDRHQVHDADSLLERLGAAPADAGWRPAVPGILVDEGRAALARAGVQLRPAVGLLPGAAWGASKQWPPELFGRLVPLLMDGGARPLVVIGPGEETLAAAISEAAGLDVPTVGPELDVAGLFGLLSLLETAVCNDSGPMHLAALTGTPVVALFGPTDPRRTAPTGDGHRLLHQALECSPCFKPVCPLGHQDCLRGIGAERVAAEVFSLLN
jgi:lipopolysaccharide heptosyltransferase II